MIGASASGVIAIGASVTASNAARLMSQESNAPSTPITKMDILILSSIALPALILLLTAYVCIRRAGKP
jgi:hypothetical protein